jgi:hypothetical protein
MPRADAEFWTKRLKDTTPHEREPERCAIGASTPFVFWSITTPLPHSGHYGRWEWFVDPERARGFLRHVLLPSLAGEWLLRGRWENDDPSVFLSVEEVVRRASQDADWEPDDLALFQSLARSLDRASTVVGLRRVAARFNARFARTPTFDLQLHVFKGPADALTWLAARRDDGEEDWEEARAALAKLPRGQAALLEVFENDEM